MPDQSQAGGDRRLEGMNPGEPAGDTASSAGRDVGGNMRVGRVHVSACTRGSVNGIYR